ncbi:hypothetical protein OG361_39855 [Streptomyces sp. NBC_00090]|uniref:hypothetical protein n=1 Tax=Streptomyces sp. NBC_00090 TaxID=2903619 RepID=UPI003243F35F
MTTPVKLSRRAFASAIAQVISVAYARSDDDRGAARAGAVDAAREAAALLKP